VSVDVGLRNVADDWLLPVLTVVVSVFPKMTGSVGAWPGDPFAEEEPEPRHADDFSSVSGQNCVSTDRAALIRLGCQLLSQTKGSLMRRRFLSLYVALAATSVALAASAPAFATQWIR
jgi:hypothetical protein